MTKSNEERLRVMVVDDHALFRRGLEMVLGNEEDLELVGEASDGQEAVERAQDLMPDVVLMDVRMPRLDGIAAATRIKASLPSTLVVLVSVTHPDDLRHEAGGCGASAILSKGALRPSLLEDLWRRHVEELPPA